MPGRFRFACLIATSAVLLAACGKASIDSTTPYFLDYNTGDTKSYTLTADITEVEDGVINESTQPVVVINGTPQAMSGDTFGPQTYVHTETGNTGLNVHFETEYQINYLLGPATRRTRDPDAGTLMIPIVGAGIRRLGNVRSDLDGDGVIDRYDNCPFHANPEQADTSPALGNRIGDACDAGPGHTRSISFTFGCPLGTSSNPDTACEHGIDGQNAELGSIMLENTAGEPVWAIKQLVRGSATVDAVSGVFALADIDIAELNLGVGQCTMLYQDPDGELDGSGNLVRVGGHREPGMPKRFVLIYGGENCGINFRRNNSNLAIGVDPLIMIVIDNSNPANPGYGKAWGYGRVTLQAFAGHEALVAELTGGSATGYLYFVIRDFNPIGAVSYAESAFQAQFGADADFDINNPQHRFYLLGQFAAEGAFVVHP